MEVPAGAADGYPGVNPSRPFNDDRRRLFAAQGRIAFVCECPDPRCQKAVLLTAAEYDEQRLDLILHESHGA